MQPNSKGGPTKSQEKQYFERQDQARQEFESYAQQYISGNLTSEQYRAKMRKAILDYLTDLAILVGEDGYQFNEDDINDLESYVKDSYDLLDGMIEHVHDRTSFSDRYIIWRAGIFGFARQVFIRYIMPRELWDSLPEIPGELCLGDGACGCSWEWTVRDDGSVEAYWILGPTEHCAICLSNAAEYSPYVISAEDLG